MTTRKTNTTRRISDRIFIASAILTLMFLTTAANASCFDRARGASPAVPSGLIAKQAVSPTAAHGTIVGLWDVIYTTSDNELFQESYGTGDRECQPDCGKCLHRCMEEGRVGNSSPSRRLGLRHGRESRRDLYGGRRSCARRPRQFLLGQLRLQAVRHQRKSLAGSHWNDIGDSNRGELRNTSAGQAFPLCGKRSCPRSPQCSEMQSSMWCW